MLVSRLLFLSALCMTSIGAALAQSDDIADAPITTPSPAAQVEVCLSEADQAMRARDTCIGVSVIPCSTDALTTVDMLGCLAPETEVWETRVLTALEALRAVYAEQDAYEDPLRALAPRLDAYQANWIIWRDAKCGFEYDKFRGGSMGRITRVDCRLDETARRALELEGLIEEAGL